MKQLSHTHNNREILTLHILRILFSFLVVVVHYWQKVGNPKGGFFGFKDFYYVSLGGVAVTIFIFLSGLLLSQKNEETLVHFYARRLEKIFRVYWASIPLVFLTSFVFIYLLKTPHTKLENVQSLQDILIFFTGTLAFFAKWLGSVNSPAWFIGLIVSLYVFYPFLAWFIERTKWFGLLVLLGVSLWSRYHFTAYPLLPARSMDWFPPSRFFEFGLGIYLHGYLPKLQNAETIVGDILKHLTLNKWGSGGLVKKGVIYLANLSFPLFLVHMPLLSIIDYFHTTNEVIFLFYVSLSLGMAIMCLFISKWKLWLLFIMSLSVLSFYYLQFHQVTLLRKNIHLISKDAMWCWISDPRAVYVEKTHSIITGWVTSSGDVQVGKISVLKDGSPEKIFTQTAQTQFQSDDHVNPSFVIKNDTIEAYYSKHSDSTGIFFTKLDAQSLKIMSTENVRPGNEDTLYTYVAPFSLPNEDNTVVFYRGSRQKPYMAKIDTNGVISSHVLLLDSQTSEYIQRPYVKYVTDSKRAIHIAYTDAHPREIEKNGIYYMRLDIDGSAFNSKNEFIGNVNQNPIYIEQGERLYKPSLADPSAMIWDIKTFNGIIAIAYTRLLSPIEHEYRVLLFDGSKWNDRFVGQGGGYISQTPPGVEEIETHFSGGMVIDPREIDVAYISKEVLCDNEKSWDIFKVNISTVETSNLTKCITRNNIRPYAVDLGEKTGLLFVSFRKYISYTSFDSSLYYVSID